MARDQDYKVRENRARRAAHRRGLELWKNPRRDPRAVDYGSYMLIDAQRGGLVADFGWDRADSPDGPDWLADVEVYLARPASNERRDRQMADISVQITMDDEDFSHLCNNSGKWAEETEDHVYKGRSHPGWRTQTQSGRFEVDGAVGDPPSLHWKVAYWIGTEYATVILAKAFLAARGFEYQVAWDLAEPGEWVILTDYDHIWQRPTVSALK